MKKILLFSLFVLVAVLVWTHFDIGMYASLDALKDNRMAIMEYVDGNYTLAAVVFTSIYVVATIFSLPIATFLTLLSGFLFGIVFGTIFVVVGATIGATIVYLLARTIFHDWFYSRFGKKVHQHLDNIEKDSFNYLLFLRLVPIFPFFLVNIAPAFVHTKTRDYVLSTFIGIIPGTFVYVYAGQTLETIDAIGDILSPGVIIAFVLLGIISIIPVAYRHLQKRRRSIE